MTGEKQKFKKEVTLIRFSQKQRVLKSFLIILLSQAKRKERRKENDLIIFFFVPGLRRDFQV